MLCGALIQILDRIAHPSRRRVIDDVEAKEALPRFRGGFLPDVPGTARNGQSRAAARPYSGRCRVKVHSPRQSRRSDLTKYWLGS